MSAPTPVPATMPDPPRAPAALAELVRLALGLPEDPEARRVTPGAAARTALGVDAATAGLAIRTEAIVQAQQKQGRQSRQRATATADRRGRSQGS